MLRQLWPRRLPAHAQAILAAQSKFLLEKVADKIVEIPPAQPTLEIQATSTPKAAVESVVLAVIKALTK